MPERERDDPPGQPEAAPAHPPPDAVELPSTFGKYFLTEKLATGGMAEIYLSKIVGPGGFEKQLVIKQIHPRLSGQRHFVDLFVAEAKTLVTLAHGNIVPVYELGVIDDTYFIAMEYIDGPTLYRLTETLRRRDVHMEPAIAAWVTARILEGLDYAHRKGEGVIHRDLSPRNVMLSRDGEVKIVDFGIAVTLGESGEDDTGQSAPTGSCPYMSPEQVRKEPLTVQTDLFSVGVLFWEMLVGKRLFARPDPEATLRAVVDGDIARPSSENPAVPARLDDLVMRALARDLTARWASAEDMRAALQRYLYGLDESPGPRDIAALVARYCPPETRRLPTHHDVVSEPGPPHRAARPRPDEPDEHDEPDPAARDSGEPPRPGPMTAVIPRDGSRPRGKRPARARTETFATHVELDEILVRAAPASGSEIAGGGDGRAGGAGAIERDDDGRNEGDGREGDRRENDRPENDRPENNRRENDRPENDRPENNRRAAGDRDDATPVRPRANDLPATASASPARVGPPPIELPGRMPPSGSLLVIAGLGALGLAAASVYVFYQGRSAVERPDAPPRGDARPSLLEPDAAPPGDALPADAAEPPVDAAEPAVDAAPPLVHPPAVDAGLAAPRHDAGARPPRPDARDPGELLPRIDAGALRPAGNATLTIGANPWGNVLLDGKRIGRTPIERLSVPAGHHVVEVIFGGEDPPRSQKFPLDLADGDTRDVQADFTHP
jgi:serine/threonine protein kinase